MTPSEIHPPSPWLYIRDGLVFSPLVLVLIRRLFRSLHCPGYGLKKTLEIVEGY
jgi:hypothetical protein